MKDRIEKALEGNFRKEHVFALEQAYEAYEFFHDQILRCENAIEQTLSIMQPEPSEAISQNDNNAASEPSKRRRKKTVATRSPYGFDAPTAITKITKSDITTIPGIEGNTAMKILSEIGNDMSQWPNAKAFASWLGLSPGNKISGGKLLSSRTRPSNNQAAQALRMAAATLYQSKTALGAFFRRMRARLGAPKAITATAHKLARILYRMLIDGAHYREAGENYYEQQYQARVVKNLTKRAKELGYVLVPAQ